MSKKTIANLSAFVIWFALVSASQNACSRPASRDKVNAHNLDYNKPKVVGTFDNPEISESSGIAASLCQKDVFWTHNDAGDGPFIFAIDGIGRSLGTWRVENAKNTDWEDMSTAKGADGKCYLYIGEIGNNQLARTEAAVYRVAEPLVNTATVTKTAAAPETDRAAILRFRYPDTPHNAETLLLEPRSGTIYILTKRVDGPAAIYRLEKPVFDLPDVAVAEKVGEIAVPSVPNGLLTGGAASPDGSRVMLCDYSSGYELVLPSGAASFDEIWKQKPAPVDLGSRKQGESVTYSADGRSVMATSEKKGAPLIQITRSN